MRVMPLKATYCGTPIETCCKIIGGFRAAMAAFWMMALTLALMLVHMPQNHAVNVGHTSDYNRDDHHNVNSTPHDVAVYVGHASDDNRDDHHNVNSTPHVTAAYVGHTSDDNRDDHHNVNSTPHVTAAYVGRTSDDNRDDHHNVIRTPHVTAAYVGHTSYDNRDDHHNVNSTPHVVATYIGLGVTSDDSPGVYHGIRTLCGYVGLIIAYVYFAASLIFALILIQGVEKKLSRYLRAFMWFSILEICLMILAATGSSILLEQYYKNSYVITAMIWLFTVIYILQLNIVYNTGTLFDLEKYYLEDTDDKDCMVILIVSQEELKELFVAQPNNKN